ncbi:hypothetical protein OsI_35802 [Oryza sativa Indica Group]|uniref:Uncharacterized protein n=1 Tax=Oryza sativa subsp. indica TaxID=39946 RepID=A2ZDD7_ORYSI|nr:hypothetical protein OsI_35802 [Oryza sativa Indica Group]
MVSAARNRSSINGCQERPPAATAASTGLSKPGLRTATAAPSALSCDLSWLDLTGPMKCHYIMPFNGWVMEVILSGRCDQCAVSYRLMEASPEDKFSMLNA